MTPSIDSSLLCCCTSLWLRNVNIMQLRGYLLLPKSKSWYSYTMDRQDVSLACSDGCPNHSSVLWKTVNEGYIYILLTRATLSLYAALIWVGELHDAKDSASLVMKNDFFIKEKSFFVSASDIKGWLKIFLSGQLPYA